MGLPIHFHSSDLLERSRTLRHGAYSSIDRRPRAHPPDREPGRRSTVSFALGFECFAQALRLGIDDSDAATRSPHEPVTVGDADLST